MTIPQRGTLLDYAVARHTRALERVGALLTAYKFNPNHDPDNGEFSEGPGGGTSRGVARTVSAATPVSTPASSQTAHSEWNQASAIVKHEAQLKAYRASLSGPQQRAVNEYANGNYKGINGYLRGGGSLDGNSAFAHASKNLLASMQPLPERALAFRGINGTLKAFHTPGAIIQDKAFLSTSVDEGVATQFSKKSPRTIAAFWIPKGTKAAFANHRSHGDKNGEREVILPPGAKFKVLGRRRSAVFKAWVVDMAYVP